MLDYRDYETAVFEWLMAKHKADPNFTFTVRQSANKGSETDYFIGTEKSKYFATTFWTLPVSFPGSSGDCISLILQLSKKGYSYFFEFNQTQTPHDSQNQSALNLIKALKEPLEKKFKFKRALKESNKMYTIQIAAPEKIYGNLDFMLADIDKQLADIIDLTDIAIKKEKQNNPDFKANRVTQDEFNELMERLSKRIERHDIGEKNKLDNQGQSEIVKDKHSTGQKGKEPKNQILFGPPGTGKTYNTINKALKILEVNIEGIDRSQIKEIYDKKVAEGQIVFTTFHQSLSYEDFIEGIKPQAPIVEGGNISYEIEPGIFKSICETAKTPFQINTQNKGVFENASFFKMSIGGKQRPDIHDYCLENNVIGLGYGNDEDFTELNEIKDWKKYRDTFIEKFPNLVAESKYHIQAMFSFQRMRIGDIVVITKGNHVIDAVGKIVGDYYYDNSSPNEYSQFRKVEWLAKNINQSPSVFFNKNISQQTIYEFYQVDVKKEAFESFFEKEPDQQKNYVLIIDEINRGNVSQIFGELITLLEEDKREGRSEALQVTLPYSKEKFSVPSNLYIIGTMNTADRSVESLDTALRRRFCFEEMMPNYSLLEFDHSPFQRLVNFHKDFNDITWERWQQEYDEFATDFYSEIGLANIEIGGVIEREICGKIESNSFDLHDAHIYLGDYNLKDQRIDLRLLLKTINQRIELLFDRDHQIGHTFFLKIKESYNLYSDLCRVFKNEIIPLLQEYFFGDYEKIGLILGQGFIKKEEPSKQFFADFKGSTPSDYYKSIFTINNEAFRDNQSFINAIGLLLNKKEDPKPIVLTVDEEQTS